MSTNLKSHFKFNKQERSGIFFLLLFLIIVQVVFFLYQTNKHKNSTLLTVDSATQIRIDSLKAASMQTDSVRIFPFNPNFITDYKGYTLGMSVEEIDRLHNFRAGNKFVNSKEEFQNVTKVSDSLLHKISLYFKFPEWTQNNDENRKPRVVQSFNASNKTNNTPEKLDLNSATSLELQRINGIGDKLSARIIKFRDRLGGFLIDGQLYDVYGLKPEVVDRALLKFTVIDRPKIERINLNEASVEELSQLIYIQKDVAQRIINYRNLNGGINSLNELINIEGFPSEQIERIGLYLSL